MTKFHRLAKDIPTDLAERKAMVRWVEHHRAWLSPIECPHTSDHLTDVWEVETAYVVHLREAARSQGTWR